METMDLKAALSKAFDNLRKKGFIARQRYMCCSGCGWAGIASDIKEKSLKPVGIVFFHKQDAEVFTENRRKRWGQVKKEPMGIYLAFGHPSDDEAEVLKAGKAIVEEFKQLPGIEVEWDGTASQRIYVKESPLPVPKSMKELVQDDIARGAAPAVATQSLVAEIIEQQTSDETKLLRKLETSGDGGEHDDERPEVQLSGEDGNAFFVIGKCRKAAKKAGWSQKKIDEVMAEMMGGDYDHLLATAMKHFEVA